MVLFKAYKPSRGGPGFPGSSDMPSRCASAAAPPARKRKKAADGVEHRPEAPTRARRRRKLLLTDDDDDMSFSEILESELLRCFDTADNLPGGEPAAPERQDRSSAAVPPPCAGQQKEAGCGDDDDVMVINLDEFLGSSAAGASPPRTAQLESDTAAAPCIQTSSQHGQSTDGDVVELEVSPEKKLMGASAPSERSGTPSALTDDDDDMCGLACPPMDETYVELILSEHIVQFNPTFIEEYISDL